MVDAIRRLRLQRTGRDRVGVAAPVQQEVLVLHVRETFRVESHADKVEVGVEAVDLDGILDVVVRRAVAVVVGILAGCRPESAAALGGRPARDCAGLVQRMSAAELHAVRRSFCCVCSAA